METLLAHHRRWDATVGFQSAEIALFDQSIAPTESRYRPLRFGGWDTPRRMRREVRTALAGFPAAVVLWHNGWGLPWFADTDGSHRRIVAWWDSRTHFEAGMAAVKPWVDGVICMSEAAAADVAQLWPELPPERCQMLPVPVEISPAFSASRPSGAEWVIGCAGRLVRPQKRADRLIPFVAALRTLGVRYRIEVVSDGPLRAELQRALGDDPAVRFLGWQSAEAYAQSLQGWDAMVSFTDHEGGPIVMLEAMAAGVLPVFPAIAGSLITDYLPGLSPHCLYPPGDVATAAARMQTLMALPAAAARRLREQAQRIALNHTVERYHGAFTSFVKRIDQLPRISRVPRGQRGSKLADYFPLGILTRFRRQALWR